MEQPPAATVHATAFLAGDRGVLVFGRSGSGKSSLAQAVIDRAAAAGLFAALVGDDRLHLENSGGRLVATAAAALRGAMEVRGAGILAMPCEASAVIHLIVRLVQRESALRHPADLTETVEGVALPALWLPEHDTEAACRAVMARLFLPPWDAS